MKKFLALTALAGTTAIFSLPAAMLVAVGGTILTNVAKTSRARGSNSVYPTRYTRHLGSR